MTAHGGEASVRRLYAPVPLGRDYPRGREPHLAAGARIGRSSPTLADVAIRRSQASRSPPHGASSALLGFPTKSGRKGALASTKTCGYWARKWPNSVNRDQKGGTVGFSFGASPLARDAESRFCFVLTDATEFDAKTGSLIIIADDGSKVALPVAAPQR